MYANSAADSNPVLRPKKSKPGVDSSSDGASMDTEFVGGGGQSSTVNRHNDSIAESFVKRARRWLIESSTIINKPFTCQCFSCCPFGKRNNVGSQYRTVIPNHMFIDDVDGPKHQPNRKYPGNKIKTTKYTLFTFLPKNLFEQFHRFANLYFVFVVLLNWIPSIEAFGKELAMIPVIFVLAVTCVKDLYEDRRRYRSDQKINHSTCRVYSKIEQRYTRTEWQNVIVGDIIHLSCNEIIPADVLLLRSSDQQGVCFVETSNLDGESNLKQRQVISSLQEAATFEPTDFKSTIECELPNNQIYKFNGFLLHPNGNREAINKNNLLLRGCEVRNTDFIEGIVVYAGHETKAMLNNSGPRYKRSKLERMMNWDIVWCVVILLVLCFIGAVGSGIWLSSFQNLTNVVYLPFNRTVNPAEEGFVNFWSYIIILQVMIPISLYVSIEIVKLGQIFFITQDRQLYHAASNKRIQCRALNIPEELGQIQYVMSDKTGTLTENQMIFRRCAIAGFDYGPSEINLNKEQTIAESIESSKETSKDVKANPLLQKLTLKIWSDMQDEGAATPSSSEKQTILDFFVNMALCNTVVVNPHPHKDSMNASGYVASDGSTPSASNMSFPNSLEHPKGFYEPANHLLLSAQPMPLQLVNKSLNGLKPLAPTSFQSPQTFIYPPLIPPIESPNGFSHPSKDIENGVYPSKDIENDFRKHATVIRRLSVSVPVINLPDEENARDVSAESKTIQQQQQFESSPDLSESKTDEHLDKNGALPTSLSFSSQHLPWLRPVTLNIGRKLLDLPRLTIQKLTPLGKKSPSTPAISPVYITPFYEAESPDELALVYASSAYGVRLVKRQSSFVTIEMPTGSLERFEVLFTLPFDSVRKRMSVIVRHPKTLKTILFSKGADTSIMDLLSDQFKESERGQVYLIKSQTYLNSYASYGLRTLCLAKRELTPDIYAKWSEQHIEAEMAIDDREQLIFDSAVKIEQDLELLGITGIEDRLQDGVAECIDSLRQGGIRVWVLTGDKIETAVNIAYACKLFVVGMDLIQLSARNEADAITLLEHHVDRLAAQFHDSDDDDISNHPENLGVVVDGRTLTYCLLPNLEDKFIRIVSRCTSVLCCRATPLQKAAVVKLVKEKLEVMTLAIGDGANDVSMIQCADVGVGISGQEGMQAVMSSDFAMARFRFLQRLLLVHGHWCYDRLARMVCYFFYKNALFVFTLFWFQLFNGFSAQVMIDPLYLMLYNLVFTSLPPLLMGVFDQDAPDELLMKKKYLYSQGSKGLLYKSHSFWMNMLDAFYQSLVIFFVPFFILMDTDTTMWSFGFLITSCLVVVNQFHLSLEVKAWTAPMVVSIVFSIGIFFTFSLCYNAIALTCCGPDPPYMVAQKLMCTPFYWLCLMFVTVFCLFPRFTFRVFYNTLRPSEVLLARLELREERMKSERERMNSEREKASLKKKTWTAYFKKDTKSVAFAVKHDTRPNTATDPTVS